MALAAWARQTHPKQAQHALIVDHAITPQSAEVAEQAAEQARGLGYGVQVLRLDWPKGPPNTQAAWRDARRAALLRMSHALGLSHLLLGHQADDQAELLAMRLAQGSGLWGLAGMPFWQEVAPGRWWGRPLLARSRAELRAFCQAEALAFHDDPANQQQRFERVRARAWLGQAPGFRTRLLALRDAAADWREKLETQARALGSEPSLAAQIWRATPPQVQAAWLVATIQRVAQGERAPSWDRVLRALPELERGAVTLGHARLSLDKRGLRVEPERHPRREAPHRGRTLPSFLPMTHWHAMGDLHLPGARPHKSSSENSDEVYA